MNSSEVDSVYLFYLPFFSILDFEFLISVQIGFKGQSKTLGPKWGTQLGVPIWVL